MNLPGSAGGAARAITSRAEALERYYQKPNKCTFCSKIIEVKGMQVIQEVRRKQFCDTMCRDLSRRKCKNCGKVALPESKYCGPVCEAIVKPKKPSTRHLVQDMTKGELFNSRSNYQSARSAIRKHAEHIFKNSSKQKYCLKCGYKLHYEICHIKDVSSFTSESKISEINALNNLIALCPTHHWEFDNGFLKIEDLCLTEGLIKVESTSRLGVEQSGSSSGSSAEQHRR